MVAFCLTLQAPSASTDPRAFPSISVLLTISPFPSSPLLPSFSSLLVSLHLSLEPLQDRTFPLRLIAHPRFPCVQATLTYSSPLFIASSFLSLTLLTA
jgi:hypothetical protein